MKCWCLGGPDVHGASESMEGNDGSVFGYGT